MNILAIDPSSTAIGYAYYERDRISLSGVVKPKGEGKEKLFSVSQISREIIEDFFPVATSIAIEIPSVHTHGRIAKAQGQAIYGVAVGIVIARAMICFSHKEIYLFNPDWKNRQPKAYFARAAKIYKPSYDASQDKGFDEADAICLAVHAERTIKINELKGK